jgi:uncharacterized membrane-anchored protein YhcB (DUF1043 family)
MRENIILLHDIAFVVILIIIAYLYVKSLAHKADIKEIKNDLRDKDFKFNQVREELDSACMEVELIYQKINTHFSTKNESSILTKEEIKKDAEIIIALKEKYSFKPLNYQLIDFPVVYPSNVNKSVSTIDVFKDVQSELEKNNIFISLSFLDVIMNMKGDTSKEEMYIKLLIIKSKKKFFKKQKV